MSLTEQREGIEACARERRTLFARYGLAPACMAGTWMLRFLIGPVVSRFDRRHGMA